MPLSTYTTDSRSVVMCTTLFIMQHIWSPWRAQHIETFKRQHGPAAGTGSIFSRMAAEDRDAENLIVWRGAYVFVVMNLYPYNNGHLLIVPYRCVETFDALTPEEQTEMAHTLSRCMIWLRETLKPEGFNVGLNQGIASGAGIPEHVHMHVVPRWTGDTNFMPTVGEVKVVPQAMQETYDRLCRAVTADKVP